MSDGEKAPIVAIINQRLSQSPFPSILHDTCGFEVRVSNSSVPDFIFNKKGEISATFTILDPNEVGALTSEKVMEKIAKICKLPFADTYFIATDMNTDWLDLQLQLPAKAHLIPSHKSPGAIAELITSIVNALKAAAHFDLASIQQPMELLSDPELSLVPSLSTSLGITVQETKAMLSRFGNFHNLCSIPLDATDLGNELKGKLGIILDAKITK